MIIVVQGMNTEVLICFQSFFHSSPPTTQVSVLKKQLEKSKDKGDFVDGGGGGGDDNVYEAANYKSELR